MKQETSRKRLQGTVVTVMADGNEIIAACRAILAQKQYGKINGQMVDSFSASAIVKIYDAISDANKAKFLNLSIARMAQIAFSLLK
jgi:hypothetical protein